MMVTGKKDSATLRTRGPYARGERPKAAASLSLAALSLLCGVPVFAQTTTGSGSPPGSPLPFFPSTPTASPTPTPTPPPPSTPGANKDDKKGKKGTQDPNAPKDGNSGYVPNAEKPLAERLLGKWGKGVTVTGSFQTMYQRNSVSGAASGQQLFNDQNTTNNLDYRSAGPLQNRMDVTISGRVFNAFDINARLSNSRYGNQLSQVFRFQYQSRNKQTMMDVGNIPASLTGNELVSFSRSLQGLMFGQDFKDGRIKMTGLASFTKGVTRRGSFRGQGTAGPYFMNASMIIEGSERVRLNGKDLTRDTDYRIDYYSGMLTFLNGRIINPEDTVEFAYEAQNYNTQAGILTGMRWNFTDPKGNAYGITYLQQNPTGQKASNGNITERFPVMADPNYRYTLNNLIDSTQPVVIKWYNRTLVEGLDYYLNKDLRYFRMLNSSLPPDTSLTGIASLEVTYRPVRQASIAGQRNVMGLDTTMHLARNGTVGIQFGQSDSPLDSQSGLAMKVTTNWTSPGSGDHNRWRFGLTYNDVDANFSTIDSTAGAFLQAQRGYRADFAFSPQKYIEFTSAFNQAQVANKDYTLSTTPGVVNNSKLVWANNQGINFGLSMNYPRLPTVKLTHQETTQTGGGVDFKSLYANTALDLGYAVTKTLQLTAGLGRTTGQGRSVFSTAYNNSVTGVGTVTGGTIIDQIQSSLSNALVTNSSSDYTRFGVNYAPFATLSLTGSIGYSRDSSGSSNSASASSSSSTSNTARTMSFGLTAMPLPNMNVNFNFMDGNNGRSTAGFYNPNSSASGGSSIIPVGDSGQSTRSTDFNWQYTPWQFMTLNYVNRHYLSLIPGYDNTTNIASTYAVTVRPKTWLDLTFNMTDQRLLYVGGQGNSKNTTSFLQATIGPIGRTQISAGMSRTRFDSATYYSNGTGSTTPGYTGGTSNSIFGNRVNGTGVLQAGVNTTYALEVQYDVFKKRMLVFGWQTLDQSSPGGQQNSSSSSSNSPYRSQTNFNQGIGTVGFAVPLDRIMKFQVNYNLSNLRDRDNNKNSYRANTFSANLGASF